jgi:hypothetical protein
MLCGREKPEREPRRARNCYYTTYLSTGDDDIFHPVLNLHRPVWMPHGQISRMEVSAIERASCRVGILEVTLHDDVTTHDDLADRFAVAWDVDELFARFCGTNDTEWERGGEGVSLPSRKFGPFGCREHSPRRLRVVASEGPISLAVVCGSGLERQDQGERVANIDVRQAVDVDRLETFGF